MKKKLWLALALGILISLLVSGSALTYDVKCPKCGSKEKIKIAWVSKNSDGLTHTVTFSHIDCFSGAGLHYNHNFEKTYPHKDGTATCNARALCSVCWAYYGEKDLNNHNLQNQAAQAATCTGIGWDAYGACTRCDYSTYAEIAALGHDYSGADRICIGCGAQDDSLGDGSGDPDSACTTDGHDYSSADATCTTDKICARTGCGAVLDKAFGHNHQVTVTRPSCTKKGYATHVCANCGDTYKDSYTSARYHWYDLWTSNGDGTHSASCRRDGCKHIGTTECAVHRVSVAETEFDYCAVCGTLGELQLPAFVKPAVENVDRSAIPGRGELIARGLAAPFDGALYALTVAHEFAGKVEPFNGTVRVTVPLEPACNFNLVRVDAPAAETVYRAGALTEIPFAYENGKLTFETDVAGLLLLIPVK